MLRWLLDYIVSDVGYFYSSRTMLSVGQISRFHGGQFTFLRFAWAYCFINILKGYYYTSLKHFSSSLPLSKVIYVIKQEVLKFL